MARTSVCRLHRLHQIMELLADGYRTASELAERFRVTKRTIEHDLLVLQGEPFYFPVEVQTEWRYRKSARK